MSPKRGEGAAGGRKRRFRQHIQKIPAATNLRGTHLTGFLGRVYLLSRTLHSNDVLRESFVVHHQVSYQIAFHLILNQGNLHVKIGSFMSLPTRGDSGDAHNSLPPSSPWGPQNCSLLQKVFFVDWISGSPTNTCNEQKKALSCATC